MIIPSGLSQSAYAHFPDCVVSTLGNDELYVSASQGNLFKVKGDDGHACLVGQIVTFLGQDPPPGQSIIGLTCDDIALDHSVDPNTLYCQ